MANKSQIGAIIKLDGESTFKASVTNCKARITELKANFTQLNSEYKGNANSLEALSAKYNKLEEIQEMAKNQVAKTTEAYERSKEKQDEVKEAMQDALIVYDKEVKKLKEMKESGEYSAAAIEEQSKQTEAAKKKYEDLVTATEKCQTRTSKFGTEVSKAKTELNNANSNIEQYGKWLREAQTNADSCANSIDEMGNAVKETSESMENSSSNSSGGLISQLTSGAAAGAAAVGIKTATDAAKEFGEKLKEAAEYAIEVGSNFEYSMSNVEAISGASTSELSQLEEKAKLLGRTTQYTATDVSDAFGYMAQAGWSASEMLDGISGVMSMAATDGIELADATDIVSSAIAAFGLNASDATDIADIMAVAAAATNTDVTGMGEAFKYVAAIAGTLNYSVEDVSLAIGLMSNNAIKGSQAGTSLKTALANLAGGSSTVQAAMQQYGVSLTDTEGNSKSLIEVLENLRESLGGLSDVEQTAAAKALFGKEAMTGMLAIVNTSTDDFEDLKEQLQDSAGAAEDMASIMNDNLQGDLKAFDSALEGLGIAVYDYFDDYARPAVELVTDAINAVTDAIIKEETELESFIDATTAASKTSAAELDSIKTQFSSDQSDLYDFQQNLDILEELQGKENLTAYETAQLESAYNSLKDSIPALNDEISNMNDLLSLTPEQMSTISSQGSAAYKKMRVKMVQDAMQAALQEQAKQENALSRAQSAYDTAKEQDNGEYGSKIASAGAALVAHNYTGAAMNLFGAENTELKEAKDSLESIQKEYNTAAESVQTYTEQWEALKEEYGLVEDASGNLVDANGEIIVSAEDVSNELEATSDAASDVTDSTEEATTALEALSNVNISDNLKTQLSESAQQFSDFKDSVQSAYESFDAFTSAADSIQEALYGTSDENEDLTVDGWKNTYDEMSAALQSNLDAMELYSDDMNNLINAGVSDDLITYLAGMGESGMSYIHALSEMTDQNGEELKKFEAQFDEYISYQEGTNEKAETLITSYAQTIMDNVDAGYNAWYQFGITSVQGLTDAMDVAISAVTNGDYDSLNLAMASILSSKYETNKNNAAPNVNTQTTLKSNNSKDSGDIVINLTSTLDGEKIAENTVRYNRNSVKRSGK